MEVRVKRTNQSYDESLCHGESKKKHKYIARIKMPNGKYRYFYDKEEYRKYLNKGKSAIEGIVDKVKSSFDDSDKKSKKVIEKVSDKKANGLLFLIPRSTIKNALSWLGNKLGNIGNGITGRGEKSDADSKISDEEKPGHKYIAKVKTANGKYRYFYDQDEYARYLDRLKYQQNEPGFMKKIRDISPDDIFTKDENMDKVNELYDPWDDSTSKNCANCSTAYELRMRGYDVEAKLRDDKYNGRGDRFYDYFEDAEVLCVYGDGSTMTADEDFTRKVYDNKVTKLDCIRKKDDYDFYTNNQSYTASSIEKAISSNNPPGSRGMIDVEWKSGGAHSIVYEVDNSGKVTIRDSQTYDTYDTSELAGNVSKVRICRTDNLQVKEGILNAVKTNEDNDREWYVDKNRAMKYED